MERLIMKFLMRNPKILMVVSLISCIGFGVFMIYNFVELAKNPGLGAPVNVNRAQELASAGNTQAVIIDSVVWDCRNSTSEGGKYIDRMLFSNTEKSFVGLAMFSSSDKITCSNVSNNDVTGLLMPMSSGTKQSLSSKGYDTTGYDLSTRGIVLCTYCGRDNYFTGVIVCGIASLLSLGIFALVLYR